MRVLIPILAITLAILAILLFGAFQPALSPTASEENLVERVLEPAPRETYEFLTPPSLVDKIYPSMLGPEHTDLDVRIQEGTPELVWVTGYSAQMVGADGKEPRSQELMCHNTLSFHNGLKVRQSVMGSGYNRSRRLFTLSQGQDRLEFPEGFGIPASSTEGYMLQSQVLNLRNDQIGQEVRHRVTTDYVKNSEATQPMQALTLVDFGINLEVLDPQARDLPDNPLGCAVDAGGQPTQQTNGKETTAHWVVRPGPETRTTFLGKAFPFDTTVHYMAVHMHSYAESFELRDLTTGKSVFLAKAKPTPDGQGLSHIDHYSSVYGLEVYANHDYEIISKYNNTSDKDQTAMAFLFCYVKDPFFKIPDAEALARRTNEFCKP
jgi:hypothetical protein